MVYKASANATPVTYYYVLNLQGDVVKLIDATGATVAEYTYNAWGEIITATGTMAETNPLRYRSYYYDAETGFYYLQSRYYDPVVKRFINADNYTSTGQSFLGTNMFAYCRNNPITRTDTQGCKDYIYYGSGEDDYYVENDWGIFEFLNPDRYYVEIDGNRYQALGPETATVVQWKNIDTDFMTTTFPQLISTADQKELTFSRVLKESIGGDLDFKNQLSDDTLYLIDGIAYNRYEAGNFVWAYYLEEDYGGYVTGALAQGGTLLPLISEMEGGYRLDEPWDVQARHNGIKHYYKSNGIIALYYILYPLF